MDAAARTRWVVERAQDLGFDLCGVAPAVRFPELAHLPEWLARDYAGEMRYLHDARRAAPDRAMPGARSVVVCAMNYNAPLPYSTEARAGVQVSTAEGAGKTRGWISRYAWGDDYHEVLGEKLAALTNAMREQFEVTASAPFDARWYVDTGPVVERVAAKYAGLGWLGKNTCLINEDLGSWLFLGVILTPLELQPSLEIESTDFTDDQDSPAQVSGGPSVQSVDSPPPDLCGQCTLCLDACPTGALVEPYVLDARRCISYLTIELRSPIPAEFEHALGWHVFGCDICQDVCPFNRKAPVTTEPRFLPRRTASPGGTDAADSADGSQVWGEELGVGSRGQTESVQSAQSADSFFAPPLDWLASLTESQFRAAFAHSAIRRTKHAGLQRNARLAARNP